MKLLLSLTKNNDNADISALLRCEIYHRRNNFEGTVQFLAQSPDTVPT